MKLDQQIAAEWRQAVADWFATPTGPWLEIRCPRCARRLHMDGWKRFVAPFVERESMVCQSCGHETVIIDEWVQ